MLKRMLERMLERMLTRVFRWTQTQHLAFNSPLLQSLCICNDQWEPLVVHRKTPTSIWPYLTPWGGSPHYGFIINELFTFYVSCVHLCLTLQYKFGPVRNLGRLPPQRNGFPHP